MSITYLATPYNDPDPEVRERRFRVVNRVAGAMMSRGENVFSPISHTHPIALEEDLPVGWDYWQQYDRAMLQACSKLVVLMQDGWEVSVGVLEEIHIARELGLPVEYIEVDEAIKENN